MLNYPVLISCVCFLLFVITNIIVYLRLSQSLAKFALQLSVAIGCAYSICFFYGVYLHDLFLISSLGIGLLIIISVIIGHIVSRTRK